MLKSVFALRSAALLSLLAVISTASAEQSEEQVLSPAMRAQIEARPASPRAPQVPMHFTPCVGGMAGIYPCSNIDLLAFEPLSSAGASTTNSLWGWTDPVGGTEYAIVGFNNGTGFYNLSTPDHPIYLGKLPTHTGSSIWRDVRVYQNHAFIVADNNGAHGMQVFDLTRLRGVTTPQTFTENAFYNDTNSSGRPLLRNVHTIAINEDTGFAYLPGSNTCPAPTSTGALHMVNISNPLVPVFAGCVTTGGYTHESQCWTYHGPDTTYTGREICINSNGPSKRVNIVDVTNKAAPVTLFSRDYVGAQYPHSAWFTEDHRYLLVDDELDEDQFGHNAWTYVFDLSDLDAPTLVGHYEHSLPVIDHNLYVHGQYVYQSNYEAGVRILRLDNLSQSQMTEVAYFDTYPASNNAQFNGTWNNYRFPNSGIVIATGIDEGLFVLKPNLCVPIDAPTGLVATPNGANRIDLAWNSAPAGARFRVERAQGGCGGSFTTIADGLTSSAYSDAIASGSVNYGYRIVRTDTAGTCVSPASSCMAAQTTGVCTAGPIFNGVGSVESADSPQCAATVDWEAATPACGGPASYSIYRSTNATFTPDAGTLIASGLSGPAYTDAGLPGGNTAQFYVVRATDVANGADDGNTSRISVIPAGPLTDGTFASGAEVAEPPFETGTPTSVGRAPSPSPEPNHAGWHTSIARIHGGERSFWSTNANNLCISLVSPPLQLTAGQTSSLSFWTQWDIEAGKDAGVIEVSTDGGNVWSRLTPAGGYPGTITTGSDCGMAPGNGAYTGSQLATWQQRSVSLAAYAGTTMQVRFLYRSDAGTNGLGWFIDDIAITHAQVPGTCTPDGSDALFADSFEDAP
jgi:choice-of-anchor B domain-containing protein